VAAAAKWQRVSGGKRKRQSKLTQAWRTRSVSIKAKAYENNGGGINGVAANRIRRK
jgi:hypothetical protein